MTWTLILQKKSSTISVLIISAYVANFNQKIFRGFVVMVHAYSQE